MVSLKKQMKLNLWEVQGGIQMTRKKKLLIIIIISIIAIIFSATYIYKYKIYRSSDEDLIRYAQHKYQIDIEVIDNRGAFDIVDGGIAEVKTIDDNELHFDIYMNMFGFVNSDSYQLAKDLQTHNQQLKKLEPVKSFEEADISMAILPHPEAMMPPESYKRYAEDVDASFFLDISEVDLNRGETIEILYEVYQLAQIYQEKVEQNEELLLPELEVKFVPADEVVNTKDIEFRISENDKDSDKEPRLEMNIEGKAHEYMYINIDDKQYHSIGQFKQKLEIENSDFLKRLPRPSISASGSSFFT